MREIRRPSGVDADSWEVFASFKRATLFHRQLVNKLLAQKGGHPGQAGLLWVLVENDGISQRDVAEALHLAPPSVSIMLQKMERAGLVERRPDERDQRVARVYLTDAGREHLRELKGVYLQVAESSIGSMPVEDQRELARLLDCVAENLAAATEQLDRNGITDAVSDNEEKAISG